MSQFPFVSNIASTTENFKTQYRYRCITEKGGVGEILGNFANDSKEKENRRR